VRVILSERARVLEDADGVRKADAMLSTIARSLAWIPPERHHASVCTNVHRRQARRIFLLRRPNGPWLSCRARLGVQPPRPRALDVLAVYHEVEGPRKPTVRSPMADLVSCNRCWAAALRLALHRLLCRLGRMPTNLAIDDELLIEAQQVGQHRTKKDTVNEALREYIQRRRQAKVVDLFGKIEIESSYDYKKQRRRP